MKKKILSMMLVAALALIFTGIVEVNHLSDSSWGNNKNITDEIKNWKSERANFSNNNGIKLELDGNNLDFASGKIYFDENMETMISSEIISDVFDCAINIYNKNKLIIEKGDNVAEIYVNKDKFIFNNKTYDLKARASKKENKIYVPISIFSDYFEYEYVWNVNSNSVKLYDNSNGIFLPERYCYLDNGRIGEVKDQGRYGTCWAFATLTALETSLMPEESYDFSENNLVYNNLLSDKIQDGGDYMMAMSYLMAWKGPVLEKDDPYNGRKNSQSDKLKAVKHVQGAEIIPKKDYQQIKEMIFKYGGVESSIYMAMLNASSKSPYYNEMEAAYCYKGNSNPNHDIVIIGWDDKYPKENFNEESIEKDGAFICLNSWGESFGQDGVFYISYEDKYIGTNNVCYTQIDETDNYDNIYQSDLCGWIGSMGIEGENTVYFANAYTANKNEKIEAVGFYTTTTNVEYEIFVCEDFEDKESLNGINHVAASGKLKNSGFYTIKLNEDYYIEEKNKFAVIVKVKNEIGDTVKLIPVEMDANNAKGKVDLTDGEGYFSNTGQIWQSAESQNCNICLKVYTSE